VDGYGLSTRLCRCYTTTVRPLAVQLLYVFQGLPSSSGALYGKVNMKWLYFISFVLFQVGSALCGAAPTMNALIVGRVITGLGGSGVYMGY
jgi:MFS family permease